MSARRLHRPALLLSGILILATLFEPPTARAQAGPPALDEGTRAGLARAAETASLAPWQRQLMSQIARDGQLPATDGSPSEPGRVERSALANTFDSDWVGLSPSARNLHTAVFVPSRRQLVVFGGNDASRCNDVWVLDLNGTPSWTQLAPTGTPPAARTGQNAIYDSARDRMVVFGGNTGGLVRDVWVLTLTGTPAWTQLAPAGTLPAGRQYASAIYDPVGDRMVVFGGNTASYVNDVWSLTFSGTPTWTLMTPGGTAPAGRALHTAVYDPVRQRMVVFAGWNGTSYYNDAWALTLGATPAWNALAPTGTLPLARYGHTAAYDAVRDRMVIHGGFDGGTYRADTWALSFAGTPAWTVQSPAGSPPLARFEHSAVYDGTSDRLLLFGGYNGTTKRYYDDVWSLALGSPAWTDITPSAVGPTMRNFTSAIFDPVRRRLILFGGFSYDPITGYYNDGDLWTLSLSGQSVWTQLAAAGTPPSARYGHAAIYDPVRDRMVFFGGYDVSRRNDTWALNLSGTPTWVPLTPAGTPPGARDQHSAIYDPVRDRMVVFSGNSGGTETWALSFAGTPTWTRLLPGGTPPPQRSGHSAIYDPNGDRMIVFGGFNLNDVWALSLGTPVWTQLTPAAVPPAPRNDHTAIYDPVRQRMVVFGGLATPENNSLWALSLVGEPVWSRLPDFTASHAQWEGHTAIYDAARDRMVVFGGAAELAPGGQRRNNAWELRWSATTDVQPSPVSRPLELEPAYPNPSRGGATLAFTLGAPQNVRLWLFDVNGRLVRSLIDGPRPSGRQTVRWDGGLDREGTAPPGVYFCELRAGDVRLARRLVVVH